MSTVAVLGAGNMGTALAHVVAGNGHAVRLWSIETDVLEEVRDRRANTKYLEGIVLHERISACWELAEALEGAALAIVSVPSQVVRALARSMAPVLKPRQAVLNVAKGLEAESHLRMSQVMAQELPPALGGAIATMGGPAIAVELARATPMGVIVAAAAPGAAADVQAILQNDHLKVEITEDMAGLELGATLKNVYAIVLGMCDGLGYGMNTKAFLCSLALAEMAGLLVALGGRPQTAYGLAGLGDLLVTGYSPHSRNRTLGERLCKGPDWRRFLRTHTVEGVAACRAGRELGRAKALSLPILEMVHDVLFGQRPAPEALHEFLLGFSYG